jgi:hypothetical protein
VGRGRPNTQKVVSFAEQDFLSFVKSMYDEVQRQEYSQKLTKEMETKQKLLCPGLQKEGL